MPESISQNLRDQFDLVGRPIETSATLPPLSYSDKALYEFEQQEIFRKLWVGIGRADRWRQPGDYAELEVAGVPVVVLRNDCGELRAFANSCRHRGAKLLEGEGNCRVIRCPFHRWTYSLDGRLMVAPKMDRTADFDLADHALVPVRVDTSEGFAFVCLDADTPALGKWLGDFRDLHDPWALSELASTRRRELEVSCNWKLFLEIFNEYYHLPYVHAETLNGLYNVPRNPDPVAGNYVTQFGSTEGTGALLVNSQGHTLPRIPGLPDNAAKGTRYSWIFPNMSFAAGRESIWVYEAIPLAPDRTRVGMTVCFPPGTAACDGFDKQARAYYERMDIALDEDIPALVNQQQGLCSPLARQGRFCRLEPSVAEFACWYTDTILGRR